MSADEPRCAHYQFAHVALRSLVFDEPRLAQALWELDDPSEILDDIAVQVVHACRRSVGEGENLRAEQLRVHKHKLGHRPCVIIEMPPPLATTEAFMIAIVQLHEQEHHDQDEDDDDDDAAEAERRYFTLELSNYRPAPHTVLAEWTDQGSHINMGAGPEPTVEAFLGELAKQLLD